MNDILLATAQNFVRNFHDMSIKNFWKKKYNSEIQILVDQTNCEVNSDLRTVAETSSIKFSLNWRFLLALFHCIRPKFRFYLFAFFFLARLTIRLKLYSFSEHVSLSYGLKDTRHIIKKKNPKLQIRWILLRKFARFYKL